MYLTSYHFLFIYLPITVLGYYALARIRPRLAKGWLLLVSILVYGSWDQNGAPTLLLVLAVNAALAAVIERTPSGATRRTVTYVVGMAGNILLLFLFKFSNVILLAARQWGFPCELTLSMLPPLGLSFLTFQNIVYLTDAYLMRARKHSLSDYFTFSMFFPHVIAGPILNPKEFIPQLQDPKLQHPSPCNIAVGLHLFILGLAKKILLADFFMVWANTGFSQVNTLGILGSWVTSLSYTLQLYFDFSGYCDMAIGIGLLFNLRLPDNFDSPYKATTIQDFWRRWHITLGKFLVEYIYIPLGGNRKGQLSTISNIMIVFFVCGVWHGAGMTFLVWGLLHGLAMVAHRIWRSLGWRMPSAMGWLLTFNFVNAAWVFFRADSLGTACELLARMYGLRGVLRWLSPDTRAT